MTGRKRDCIRGTVVLFSFIPFVLNNERDEILGRRDSLLQHRRTAETNTLPYYVRMTTYCSKTTSIISNGLHRAQRRLILMAECLHLDL